MKREGQLYLLIGLIAAALVFFQFNPLVRRSEKFVTEVKKVGEFNHLSVNVKCNIFFVEGEEQGIVYEGPASMVKKIRIDIQKGCISINKTGFALNDFLFGWIHPERNDQLNVYVVIRDINSLDATELSENILPCSPGGENRILYSSAVNHIAFKFYNNNLKS
jgi:hypothetical protein